MNRFILIRAFVVLFLISSVHCGGSSVGNTGEEADGNQSEAGTTSFEVSTCDASTVDTSNYIMAFHACEKDDCDDPDSHVMYLAKSDDGSDWSIIEEFDTLSGSVPELIYYNNYLYLFTPGDIYQYDACFQKVAQIEFDVSGDQDGLADPSVILDDAGDINLFFLPSFNDEDLTGCNSYPCIKQIQHATPDDDSLESFTGTVTAAIEALISSGSFSDPEVVLRSDGTYIMYVSAAQNTFAFVGDSLSDSFTIPDAYELGDSGFLEISSDSGGVPGAIAVGDEIWLYVTTNTDAGVDIIRRVVSSDGLAPAAEEDFTTVLSPELLTSFSSTSSLSSPSIIAWPDSDWVASE
jgi:hypothetical protein